MAKTATQASKKSWEKLSGKRIRQKKKLKMQIIQYEEALHL